MTVIAKTELKTEADTINTMIEISQIEQIKGQKLAAIKQVLDSYGIPIRYFVLDGTSPYIDPNGKSYIKEILLSYLTLEQMNARIGTKLPKGIVLTVTIEGPYNIDIDKFVEKYHMDVFDKAYSPTEKFNMVKDMFTIKSITFWYMDY